ncbi:MAG: AI-2E family transporter [Elusimicrobiota bacterium]
MSIPISNTRLASYALFLLALVAVARFHLGALLLTLLISYMIMDMTERRLIASKASPLLARWGALSAFAVLSVALAWVFVAFLRVEMLRLPLLLDTLLPRLGSFAERYGFDFPADNAKELRDVVVAAMRENSSSIGKTSDLLTRGFFQVVIGMFAAMMHFLTPARPEHDGHLYDALRHETNARAALFMNSFERVVAAQVLISTLNTLLTMIFLHAMDFPFKMFLTLTTFVCGMVPIIGNVISNIFIMASGLIVSEQLAIAGLIYLIVIHKIGYLLNSRILGGSIDTPMWMMLLGIVVGEALMGVPGVLLAPALLHYARAEMRALPSPSKP